MKRIIGCIILVITFILNNGINAFSLNISSDIVKNAFANYEMTSIELSEVNDEFINSSQQEEKNIEGWQLINNEWYYFDSNGKMLINSWLKQDTDWYYLGNDGIMYKSKWLFENNKYYYFGIDGKLLRSNWVDGIYYVDENGEMISNDIRVINNESYTFDSKGKATKNSSAIVVNNNKKSTSSQKYVQESNDGGPWYTKTGSCYHEKYGCSGATLSYPPKNKSYRPCSKCCH